jgi:YYY domain-containing protein
LIYGMFVFIFASMVFANLLRPRLSAQVVAIKNSLTANSNGLSKLAGTFKQDPAYRDAMEDASVSHGDVQIGSNLSTASGPYLATPVREQLLHQPGDRDTTTSMVEATTDQSLADSSPSGIQPTAHTRSSRAGWLDMRLISLVLIMGVALLAFAILKNGLTFAVAFTIAALGAALALYHIHDRPRAFTLLLGALAFGLVAMTEIIFLKDVFAASYPRMNTVFKFYFQAWALLSIASGAGLYFILDGFRPAAVVAGMRRWIGHGGRALWSVMLALFILAGLVYPVVGSYQRTNQFTQRTNSLDGLNYMQSYDPGDYYAIRWLNSTIQGDPVIVEAYGPQGGDYSDYGRISAFTGLPTLMGWAGHEYQWRVNWLNKDSNAADFYRRGSDINSIYTDTHPGVVLALMAHYNAQYLYVGPLEQMTYTGANLQRFKSFMKIVYAADGVTIYQVP